jgi:hypothetical protein
LSQIEVEYNEEKNHFLISAPYDLNYLAQGLPDRKWSKRTKKWTAPALRKNIEYINGVLSDKWQVSDAALERLQAISKIKGEDATYNAFPAWYPWKTAPYDHQRKTLDKAVALDFYALLFDQGLGKTYTAINLATMWRMSNQIDAVVAVCLSANMTVWEEQIPEHCPIPAQVHLMQAGATATRRFNKFNQEGNDYPWLVVGVEALSNGSGFEKMLQFMKGRKVCILIDESSCIKNHKANRTDRLDHSARLPSGYKRLILSGTSLTEGVENWYSQFHFLEPDVVGYNNFYSFRNRYCITKDIPVDPTDPFSRTFTKVVAYKNLEELAESVSFCTSRYEKEEVLDLPEKTYQTRVLKASPAQKKALKELEDDGYTLIEGEDILCDRAITVLLRTQQIAGGFYPVDDPDDPSLAVPLPGKNPKLEDLLHWLGETSGKVIVWCNFRAEHAMLCAKFEKLDISFVSFAGGMSKDQRKQTVDYFRQDDTIKVFCCTYAAAYGLTLVEAQDNYYYSQTFSAEKSIQSEDRTHRIGTTGTVTYTTPLLEGSPDRKLRAALKRKRDTASTVYDLLEE